MHVCIYSPVRASAWGVATDSKRASLTSVINGQVTLYGYCAFSTLATAKWRCYRSRTNVHTLTEIYGWCSGSSRTQGLGQVEHKDYKELLTLNEFTNYISGWINYCTLWPFSTPSHVSMCTWWPLSAPSHVSVCIMISIQSIQCVDKCICKMY